MTQTYFRYHDSTKQPFASSKTPCGWEKVIGDGRYQSSTEGDAPWCETIADGKAMTTLMTPRGDPSKYPRGWERLRVDGRYQSPTEGNANDPPPAHFRQEVPPPGKVNYLPLGRLIKG